MCMGSNANQRDLLAEQVRWFGRKEGEKKGIGGCSHKILIAAYFILKNKESYKELGGEFLETRNREKQIKRHLQKLRDLGVDVSDYAA